MKGILSYFPVELLKMRAEKRHNAYKTQVLCIPTNKNPKISDSMDLNNSPGEMLIFVVPTKLVKCTVFYLSKASISFSLLLVGYGTCSGFGP